MQPYNWNQFTKRITIHAPIQSIYDAWATPEGIESWFLRRANYVSASNETRDASDYVQAGDAYEWLWHGYDDTMVERSQILEANGTDTFKFGFSGGCIVTVNMKLESGENICELVQDMTPPNEKEKQFFYIECSKGWTFYLANLKSILEGGIDLRNKNVDIANVVNA